MKTLFSCVSGRGIRTALAAAGVSAILAGSATAQTPAAGAPPPPDPNPGSLTFTGNIDVLPKTAYIFRGIVQEGDPKLTLWPSGDLGIAVFAGEGGLKTASVNLGVWHSLHTGSSGLDNSVNKLHYEEDFYTTLGLGFDKGVTLATTYTAYTSPNGLFATTHEIAFKLSQASKIAPYGLVAFELKGGADAGPNKGTYVELGVGPSWPLGGGKATLAIPVKVGLSASNYYEHPLTGVDNKFGFFDVGALLTVPLSGVPSSFGAWNFHIGGDALFFGETTKAFNAGESKKGVFLFGIGVSY